MRFFVDPQTCLWTRCAPSFEVFIKRFWIEHALAISLLRDEPVLDEVLRGYLEPLAGVAP